MSESFTQLPDAFPIAFVAGDDVSIPFELFTEDDAGVETPIDISAYKFNAFIITGAVDIEATITKVSTSAIVVNFTASQTMNHRPGQYAWYLRMTDASNKSRTLIQSKAEIIDHASRIAGC